MDADQLKQALREVRNSLDENHAIRLHRAVSWLRCAESYHSADDDIAFIALWIAFNACYGVENESLEISERRHFKAFAEKLCFHDKEEQVHNLLWSKYSQFVRLLIDNEFVYAPFWASVRDGGDDGWKASFEKSKRAAFHALARNDTPLLLSIILDRLYVLRNQLLHGGATYQSKINRQQVSDGGKLLFELVPIFIEIMFVEDDWGEIYFPVVSKQG